VFRCEMVCCWCGYENEGLKSRRGKRSAMMVEKIGAVDETYVGSTMKHGMKFQRFFDHRKAFV